jgi:uncharacterized protein (UPF0332 family)
MIRSHISFAPIVISITKNNPVKQSLLKIGICLFFLLSILQGTFYSATALLLYASLTARTHTLLFAARATRVTPFTLFKKTSVGR